MGELKSRAFEEYYALQRETERWQEVIRGLVGADDEASIEVWGGAEADVESEAEPKVEDNRTPHGLLLQVGEQSLRLNFETAVALHAGARALFDLLHRHGCFMDDGSLAVMEKKLRESRPVAAP